MTEPQNPTRIEGATVVTDFHYVKGDRDGWAIYRKADGVFVDSGIEPAILDHVLAERDAQANHFLELGRAENEKDYGPTASASEDPGTTEDPRVAASDPVDTDPFALTVAECAILNHAGTSDEMFGRMVRVRVRQDLKNLDASEPPTATPDTDGGKGGDPYDEVVPNTENRDVALAMGYSDGTNFISPPKNPLTIREVPNHCTCSGACYSTEKGRIHEKGCPAQPVPIQGEGPEIPDPPYQIGDCVGGEITGQRIINAEQLYDASQGWREGFQAGANSTGESRLREAAKKLMEAVESYTNEAARIGGLPMGLIGFSGRMLAAKTDLAAALNNEQESENDHRG